MKLENTKNSFKIPDNYFDNFYDRLKERIDAEDTKSKTLKLNFNLSKKDIIKILKPIISIAAVFIIVFILINIDYKTTNFSKNQTIELTENEILYVLLSKLDDVSFYELLNESNTSNAFEKFTDNEIEEYVSSSISDYELYNSIY